MSTQQREAFEAWVVESLDEGRRPDHFDQDEYGYYEDFDVQRAWRAWQAAQQAQGEAEPEAYLLERVKGGGPGNPRRVIDAAKYDPRKNEFWAEGARQNYRVTPLHPQSAQRMPEGWSVERVKDTPSPGFVVRSPRLNEVQSGTAVFEDSDCPAERLLYMMLANAPEVK